MISTVMEPRAASPAAMPLAARYAAVRSQTERLCIGLAPEDQVVQSMPDVSPTKWHLAHTTWFFETVVLAAHVPGYRPFDARFAPLFNSYYESLGPRHPRPQRGLLTRPALQEVQLYRAHVDAAVTAFSSQAPSGSACASRRRSQSAMRASIALR